MKLLILLLLAFSVQSAEARIHRSSAARHAFERSHPCPSTGKNRGSCPGYVIDHIVPLCAGGADDPANMQWQEMKASKLKDNQERRTCRELRKHNSE
ncbi:MAG: HNH endonuclease [Sideroxydans sp.]|nr:HNH endonuclease [Sideroxydans sp.]